ncbi:MAG: hypothetical protein IIT36_04230 [Aeriscardovia sp.]|nr:hypothetical protein [Aeriscardovia sp.]
MTASLIGDNVQVPLTVNTWQTTLSASLQSVHGQNAWWFQAWTPEQGQAQLTVQPVSRRVFDESLGLLQAWSESNRIVRFFWPERNANWQVTISNATATLKPDTPVPSINLRLQLLSSWMSSENTAVLPTSDNLSMIAGRMVHRTVNQLTASAASQTTSAPSTTSADSWSVAYHGKDCTITVMTGPHKGTVLRNVPAAQAAQYLSQGYSPVAFQALQELSRENSQPSNSGRSQTDIWHETLGDIISQWL